jgi:branched-chain amino acid transport system substrate-binding protein
VTLGALFPLTGPAAPWGRRTWNGIQLACEVVNGQGGIRALGGARLAAAVADTESRAEVAGLHAARAMAGGAAALIGCNQSAASIVVSQVAERSGVPFVTPTDLEPEITARGFAGTFRTAATLDDYARDLLGYVRTLGERQGRPPRRLAILSDSSKVGRSAAEGADQAARALGYNVTDVEIYERPSADFRGCVQGYRDGGVEVVVGHNALDDAVRITRAMRDVGFTPKAWGGILGGQASPRYASALGPMASGVLGVAAWWPDLAIPGLAALEARYRERFGERLDAMAAAGVTAIAVIRDALERAASVDRVRLREALAATDLRAGERLCLQLRGVRFLPSGNNGRAGGPVLVVTEGVPVPVAPPEYARAVARYPKPPWGKS